MGVTADGAVLVTDDAGETWSVRGDVGREPEAIAVATLGDERRVFIAVAARGIVESSDGGQMFRLTYSDR